MNQFHSKQRSYSWGEDNREDNSLDWRVVSLERVENYINLFIVIWNALPGAHNAEFSRQFEEEAIIMTQIIEELGISKSYSEILDNYRNSRHNNNQDSRRNLIRNAWTEITAELEVYGLRRNDSFTFSDQLSCCTLDQKRDLRQMVFSRMRTFQLFAKENENLKRQVDNLQKENSRQQAALGNLTNVSWNDDDPNNAKRLISDIEELQDMLSDFTMVQGNDYKVNDESAASLLEEYKCQTKYPNTKVNSVLEAALQYHVINIILENAKQHLQNPYSSGNTDPNLILESNIVDITEKLITHTELLRNNRNGEDDITRIAPIKVRQHAYSALSCRGFPNEHPLIKRTADKLLDEMNKFRQVLDKETNAGLHEQAIQIACKIVNIFCFRLKTQALEPTYEFFQAGQDIDIRFMQGAFGRDDVKNLEVEICGFPCIGVFDKPNQKVYTKAQVIARPKRSKSWDKKNF